MIRKVSLLIFVIVGVLTVVWIFQHNWALAFGFGTIALVILFPGAFPNASINLSCSRRNK